MASTRAFVRQRPRVATAVNFGVAGSVVPASWFLPSVPSRRDGVALVLYVVVPGVAAALAGTPLRGPARTISQGNAVVWGAAVATLALVIFALTRSQPCLPALLRGAQTFWGWPSWC